MFSISSINRRLKKERIHLARITVFLILVLLAATTAGVLVERISEYVRLFQAGDRTFAERHDLLAQVLFDLQRQRAQLDAAIEKLSFKVSRYEAAVRTGVLSWERGCKEHEGGTGNALQ